MDIIKKIFYALLTLFGIFGVFVIVCAFNPDITQAVAAFLYSDQKQAMAADIPRSNLPVNIAGGNGDTSIRNNKAEFTPTNENALSGEDGLLGNDGIAEGISSDYIPPEQSDIVVPENVSGRNGYQQIQDEQEQIDDDVARELERELDTGYTGDGLEFDPLYYPYYDMLNEKGQHLYRQIYANANKIYPMFAPVEPVTAGELRNIFMAVYNDHPELFWLETAYSCKYVRSGRCVEIDLRFNRTAQNLDSAKASFNKNANQILSEAQNLSDNYEKERFVHDELIDRISYDLRAEMNQSAYSALVSGQTVCAGYARAFQYLMQQLGVPCYYCTGFAGERHAWNIIMLDDEFYNVDTTWDDTGSGTYDYFNKTDDDYASSHIRQELSVYLPPCSGKAYRNLEQAEEEPLLRSLEDVGFTPEQVITNMQDYNKNCYNWVVQSGTGSYTFYNVIEGEDLLRDWHRNYDYDTYRRAYMEDAMKKIGASFCEMDLGVEELQGGRFLISHKVSMR